MKTMKTRILAALLGISTSALIFAGCDSAQKNDNYIVGISQFAEHGSLDNCRNGFIEGLKEAGIVEGENLTILYDNAGTDIGTASAISDNFVSKKSDLILAIATPSAMAAYNSCLNTEIPVVYSAITDPVAAGLANADKTNTGNITGTSDALPVKEQLELIRKVLPDSKRVGILYTTSETNSESAIAEYKRLAPEYGFEIVTSGISVIADVALAAPTLAAEVDCITNLTDNTVVSALQTLLEAANEAKIPVFGSEEEQVVNGCLAAAGLDYIGLGKQTGQMAAAILKGEKKAEEIPYEIIKGAKIFVNTKTAENLGISLPTDLNSTNVA